MNDDQRTRPGATAVAGEAEAPAATPPAFPIVGIGASAGGLKALGLLLAGLPGDTGMAYVVIQHLDPSHDSQLPALLGRSTHLPVEQALDGVEVRPDRIYVITPNTSIGIEQGLLRISPREHGPRPHLSIDGFLVSLARDRAGCVIGVLLSGTGSDGTLGLAAIKAAGGITFAQDDSAEFTGMPLSAVAHGCVDFVLPPGGIAREIAKIARFGFPCQPLARDDEGPSSGEATTIPGGEDPPAYARILALLRATMGVDFTHYRTRTIMRRTLRRMALLAQGSLAGYADHLRHTPAEVTALGRDILINVTSFYRDVAAFAALTTVAFPALVAAHRNQTPIRLWVVGCSTGQEVYSLAIELVEYLKRVPAGPQVQIFATDISDWALAKARLGSYGEGISEEIPPDRLMRYFIKEPGGYRVAKEIRDLCVFAHHDVTVDTPFSRIDLISCRNVLIYLGPVLQNYVLPTFHFSLISGAFLLLGAAETLGRAASLYATIDEKNRLYRATDAPGRTRPLPVSTQRAGGQATPHPTVATIPTLSDMQRAADQIVLGRFAPAGVLIDDAMRIIQFRGRTNPFLEPAQGEASLNLLSMVPFGVAEALSAALAEARQRNVAVRRSGIVHRREQVLRDIAFEIIPIRLPAGATSFLVLFEEDVPAPVAQAQALLPAPAASAAPQVDPREVVQLRIELAAATVYMHSLVELNQGLASQLRDAQEEAQSSTEEYRSTNEELQTTKEEVEATNQELVAMNDELRASNQGLTRSSLALAASADLTTAILETMRTPLLVLSADLRVESANRSFLETFRVDRMETIGKLVYDLGDRQWNIPELRRLLEDVLPNRSSFDDFEVTHDFHAIGRKTMLLNARRLRGEHVDERSIVLVFADITERAEAARRLREISDDLQRSNDDLDQFAAVASHDLQEPLRMISSYLGLLENRYATLFDERARDYFAHVTRGASRMREMIKAILAYSQLGHVASNIAPIASAEAYRDAVDNLAVKIAGASGTVEAGPLPMVSANREQLSQLFQNLLSNALKFRSPDRPPAIQVSASESPREWVFAVADNGVGIETAHFGKIFQLFQRVHGDRSVAGCGIGLATCRKILDHHKGRIWVESTPGVGSTFSFALPK